ncbi:uncharacterized protein LOC116196747 [Punica granatum]|uniref:Hydroxyproline-rich glycoprotein family protein n=2 Tax=Punica granatum TaxID=22663 RepID=A0A218WRX6_PUNGR|nr:uncharacterized protein LOC116196747 [Punica granatum]OWM75604.1 hypothetical protein CDL15_Pgr021769 [Punica granatum]PKI52075.1 hypothetical protein CRG98_027491 [Punica granatum]
MRSVNNSVETVNAAATAIVTAEARVQPAAVQQKRRWGSCWSLYWCFGHQKNGKRIGHAVLGPETVVPGTAAPAAENQVPAPAIVLPFIAPPSSPASFLPSETPSATQSPAGLLSLTSLSANAYSRSPASIFAIGPYAYETQLVSPPVFSTFTTEPSTAPLTPPPESVQLTTPSSPEVPFAQLLTSSLERTQRGSGVNQKFALSHYEFQPHQLYPGSPGGQLISPGSVVSNSGTSSPFPGKLPVIECRMGEAPKLLGFEHFSTWKWGSRLGSGSLTPDGAGLRSRLGSGTVTPDGMGIGSRLSSGRLTPDGMGPPSRDSFVPAENQKGAISYVPSLNNGPKHDETVIDHRVSFELTGEDVARCLANKSANSFGTLSRFPQDTLPESSTERSRIDEDSKSSCELSSEKTVEGEPGKTPGDGEKEPCFQRQRSLTLGSTKEFNFDSRSGGTSQKLGISSEWWANEKVAGKDMKPGNSWSFFPMLQPEIS